MAFTDFDPQRYPSQVAALICPPHEFELGPGKANREQHAALKGLSVAEICGGRPVVEREMALACLAGLWLYHDFLDESHSISQELPSSTGSYWHGIMHRREPDAANAKYWFRRVGSHEIFPAVLAAAREIAGDDGSLLKPVTGSNDWDPFGFVDLCEAGRRGNAELALLCKKVQLAEWQLLFDYCWQRAVGAKR